jgi:hypothetical protein
LNKAWYSQSGGKGAPSGSGYTKIYSNRRAFAALTRNGSIKVWGFPHFGGNKAPAGRGYTKIYSTDSAFAALKANASLPPESWSPHTLIKPLALRAAKALEVKSTHWQRLYQDLFKCICLCCS